MAEVTRWDPIPNVNPRQLRFIVDQALCLLAADLNDVLEPALRSLGGDEWHRTLAQEIARPGRRVYDLAKLDLTAYVDLLHSQGWAGRRELRAALMRNGDFRSVSRLLMTSSTSATRGRTRSAISTRRPPGAGWAR